MCTILSIKADLGKASRVTGVSHGKFLYNWMAPELMREESPHFSSDVYSFCCVIWEMFAGGPAQNASIYALTLPMPLKRTGDLSFILKACHAKCFQSDPQLIATTSR